MANVYLGLPVTRPWPTQYINSLFLTRLHGSLAWGPVPWMDIATGRNVAVERFLKDQKFDFLLMHDSDCTWHPDALERLVSRDLPVVTAVIFKRGLPTVPTIGKYVSRSPEGKYMYSFAETVNRIQERAEAERFDLETGQNEILFPERGRLDDLAEVDGAGAHFMLIRRDVLEQIEPPWYECTAPNAGEDFAFCRKVQAAGFPIHVDYSVMTGHVVGENLEIGLKQFLLFRDKARIQTTWIV